MAPYLEVFKMVWLEMVEIMREVGRGQQRISGLRIWSLGPGKRLFKWWYRTTVWSRYRNKILLNLLSKHGKVSAYWEGGLIVRVEVDERLWRIVKALVSDTRNVKLNRDLYEELLGKVGSLDEFEDALAPYLLAEKLGK